MSLGLSGLLSSLLRAVGSVGYMRRRWFPSLVSSGVVGLLPRSAECLWVNSGSLCSLARALCCSSLVGEFTRVRPGVRCVYLRSLGSFPHALRVVGYIRGRCVAPWISLRFIRARRVRSRATWQSLRSLAHLDHVAFNWGRSVHSRTFWGW